MHQLPRADEALEARGRAGGHRGAAAAKGITSVFSPSSPEKPLAEKPPNETLELIFEGVPVSPSPPDPVPAKAAEGGENVPRGSQQEAGEKASGRAEVEGDTSRGMEFQAVPPAARWEVGQPLSLTAREEDCFQILGRPGAGVGLRLPGGLQGKGEGDPRVSPHLRGLNCSEPRLTQADSATQPTPGRMSVWPF